jgi:hypothetical protein
MYVSAATNKSRQPNVFLAPGQMRQIELRDMYHKSKSPSRVQLQTEATAAEVVEGNIQRLASSRISGCLMK